MMESLVQDLRFAVCGLAWSRGFTAVAILTLALGAGANTAIFSVVNALLLRPLPYSQPERLVTVWPELKAFNRPLLERVAEGVPALESITGVGMSNLTASGDGEPEEVPALFVSANHFDVLGIRPRLGRAFAPGEDTPGNGDAIVLSHELWRTRYGADPFRPNPSPARHRGGTGYHRFYEDVLDRLRGMPGVESAGATQIRPLTTQDWMYPIASSETGLGCSLRSTRAWSQSLQELGPE